MIIIIDESHLTNGFVQGSKGSAFQTSSEIIFIQTIIVHFLQNTEFGA